MYGYLNVHRKIKKVFPVYYLFVVAVKKYHDQSNKKTFFPYRSRELESIKVWTSW